MSETRKSIFITGAGSGIGRAVALYFAERNWFVGLSDVDAKGLAETAAMLPPHASVSMPLDVRDRAQWAAAMETFGASTGKRMNVLFNNAGIGKGGDFAEVPQDDADLIVDVNLKGVINGVYAALPLLRETKDAAIINVASVAGMYGTPRLAIYSATKFAVRGLTEALALEFDSIGVRVASIEPWFIDTNILDATPSGGGNQSLREELTRKKVPIYPVRIVAERAWEAVHGKGLHYPVGKAAEMAQFFSRFAPALMRQQIRKSLQS